MLSDVKVSSSTLYQNILVSSSEHEQEVTMKM